MSTAMYTKFLLHLLRGEINWEKDDIKVALLRSDYAPAQSVDEFFVKVSEYEVEGKNYDKGGVSLSGRILVQNGLFITGTAESVLWANSSITAHYAVIYDSSLETCPMIGFVDLGYDRTSYNGPFQINWDSQGIFSIEAGIVRSEEAA